MQVSSDWDGYAPGPAAGRGPRPSPEGKSHGCRGGAVGACLGGGQQRRSAAGVPKAAVRRSRPRAQGHLQAGRENGPGPPDRRDGGSIGRPGPVRGTTVAADTQTESRRLPIRPRTQPAISDRGTGLMPLITAGLRRPRLFRARPVAKQTAEGAGRSRRPYRARPASLGTWVPDPSGPSPHPPLAGQMFEPPESLGPPCAASESRVRVVTQASGLRCFAPRLGRRRRLRRDIQVRRAEGGLLFLRSAPVYSGRRRGTRVGGAGAPAGAGRPGQACAAAAWRRVIPCRATA